MRKNIFYILLLLILSTALQAQYSISGFVFEDFNKNGRRDKREKGIEGVPVSNGREVVLTNSKGKYKLPVGNDNIIFVIKPSGYNVPVCQNNLPQYYYIHKPDGSPDLKYQGVPATGKPQKSVDFALNPVNENDNFSMLLFGDPQARNLEEVNYFYRGIVKELIGIQGVSFGLSMGDIAYDDLSVFKPYIEAVNEIGIPWYNVIGNHDLNFDVTADSLSDETFEAHFGPSSYAFNYGQVHFIILDNILYPDPRGAFRYMGGLRNDQREFLRNNLRYVPKDYLIVVAGHIPMNEIDNEDKLEIFGLLKDFPYTLSLSAHTHLQKHVFFTKEEGWKQNKPHHHFNVGTTSGSWWSGKPDENGVPVSSMSDGTPKGYAYLNFEGNKYIIDYKAAGYPAEYQICIYAPRLVEAGSILELYANYFIGNRYDKLMYRVDNGEWKEMYFIDDYESKTIGGWKLFLSLFPWNRAVNPNRCTHLWRACTRADFEPGEHSIEVKATDMFGKTHFGLEKFTIIKD